MNRERYFTENSDRTHVLLVQIKSKSGKWVDYEKCYSQAGFTQKDYIMHWTYAMGKAVAIDKLNKPQIRILNGMRKQVYSNAAQDINNLFVCWGAYAHFYKFTFNDTIRIRNFAFDAKIASIRFKNSELADILVMDINTEDGWKNFSKVLQDISFNNDGFKSFTTVTQTSEDNNLHWYKVKCNSGLQFSFALYA